MLRTAVALLTAISLGAVAAQIYIVVKTHTYHRIFGK